MSPRRGTAGKSVTLTGTGFDTQASYSITVDGTAATVGSVTDTSLTFTVGAGSDGGLVELDEGDGSMNTGFSFTVTRTISGTLSPPTGVTLPGYKIGGGGDATEVDAETGSYSMEIPKGVATVLYAVRGANDPRFKLIVTSETSDFTIDAESTATALAFITPAFATRVDERAIDAIDIISPLPETTALASLISSLSRDKIDYMDDARIETAWIAQLTAAMPAMSPAPAKAGPSPPTVLKEINYDPNPARAPIRIVHDLVAPTNAHPNAYRLDLNAKDPNPLDWITEIYELDPAQFPAGRTSIEAIEHDDRLQFLDPNPILTGFVRAKLKGQKVDIFENASTQIYEWVAGYLGDDTPELQPHSFALDKDTPGVYVAQSFSGNLWYGTGFFLTSSINQVNLLNDIDKNRQWRVALTANILIASLDTAALFVDLSGIYDEKTLLSYLHTLFTDIDKAIAAHLGSPGGLTKAAVYDLVKASVISTMKFIAGEGTKKALEKGIITFFGEVVEGAAKSAASALDIFGKIAAAEQALERSAGFLWSNALAVERAVVVIGNPFRPKITSFRPQRGRTGDRVHISGYNFPTGAGELIVRFCNFTQTVTEDDDVDTLPFPASVTATVESVTETSAIVKVPEGWEAQFNTGEAFVCVENAAGDQTRSTSLPEPYRTFKFIGKPTLISAEPNPKVHQGLLLLRGTNFDAEGRLKNKVLIDGEPADVANASETTISVQVPPNLATGSHNVTVCLNDDVTNPISFTVEDPPAPLPVGVQISVTKADLSNAPDGEISLLEAFLIANGTLGRPIEQHADCEFIPINDGGCAFVQRETDHVQGDTSEGAGGGPGVIDTIRVAGALTDQTLALMQTLPAPSTGDTYDFNGLILDGSGMGADAPGLLLDGVSGWNFKNLTLRNFSGHGIHMLNGARGNRLENIRIENCGKDGVFLDANVVENDLIDMKVSTAARHGLHLNGSGVRHNRINLTAISTSDILGLYEMCAGHGVLLTNGTTHNLVHPGTVRNNDHTGVLVTGAETDHNVIGRNSNIVPRLNDIYGNDGHGVHLTEGVDHTVLRYLAPAGNQGDGIRLEGPDCAHNQCDGIFTGFDYYTDVQTPLRLPNTGNGIHLLNGAHHNLLGSRTPGSFGERGAIVANDGAGVLIDGSSSTNNTINRMNIGDNFATLGIGVGRFPNGTHGIHLRNGTRNNVLGDIHSFLDLHLSAQPNGAGIMIEGAGTEGNIVFGNQIGTDHGDVASGDGALQVGVWIRNGARNNTVGQPGPFAQILVPDFAPFRPFNVIANCTRAGIVIENAGGEFDSNGVLTNANVVQNNFIGLSEFGSSLPNRVGIALTNNAKLNIIGGPTASQGNELRHNNDAGISIDDNQLATPSDSNRIQNNTIRDNGSAVVGGGITDPLLSPPPGVGVLITGTSANNAVGVSKPTANKIQDNVVGVYIEEADSNSVSANQIFNNAVAGVIIRAGGSNTIGGFLSFAGNRITDNGAGNEGEGGVVIVGGEDNTVGANIIGTLGPGNGAGANNGAGVYVKDSPGNRIGATSGISGNTIVNNTSHGVWITGASSADNEIRNNHIGTDRGRAILGNAGNGVFFNNGASGNLVGGRVDLANRGPLTPATTGNTISRNQMNGVEIDGASTTGNSILNNSITRNTMAGIRHTGGGNDNIPSPVAAVYDGSNITGSVDDLNAIPVGSIIQVFSDPDPVTPEGSAMLGETTVLTGGQWSIDGVGLPIFGTLSMTATDGVTGETSEFGRNIQLDIGLSVTRGGSATPANRSQPLAAGVVPVMNLQVGALNAPARVLSLTFTASGTLDDIAHIDGVSLYRDTDVDGQITEADVMLADVTAFDADNGTATLTLAGAELDANESQHWVVAYNLSSAPADGLTFSLELTSQQSVNAQFIFPVNAPAIPAPPFPVASDTFTVQAGVSLQTWKESHFTAGELLDALISGDGADPDGDGIANIVEYALGLDPRVPDGAGLPIARIENNKLIVEYNRSVTATDVTLAVKVSSDLLNHLASNGVIEEVSIVDNEDGTERVTLRTIDETTTIPQLFVLLQIVSNAAAP